jgi:hypothetical protein
MIHNRFRTAALMALALGSAGVWATEEGATNKQEKAAAGGGYSGVPTFEQMDKDGNGKISQEEFVAVRKGAFDRLVAAGKAKADDAAGVEERAKKAFAQADANDDGTLSKAEFSSLPTRTHGVTQGSHFGKPVEKPAGH